MNHVDNPFELLPTLSICTGIGGLERGVERVTGPLRTVAYVEIEAFIIENLLAGMEAGILAPAPIWANLKTFRWAGFRNKIFLLLGGYPCQPFSTAGLRLGSEDPRHLWPYIEFGISAIRPICVFFENVAGHLSLGGRQVIESLRSMGYAVEAGIFTADEVGAPHRRSRLFILGILAHSFGDGTGANSGGPGCESQADERKMEWEERNGIFWKWGRRYPGDDSSEGVVQDDALCEGPQGQLGNDSGAKGRSEPGGSVASSGIWPIGPGQIQYEWEEPRTIESGLGCTINGYNFREDLLRALGNGVVEQTAELAFRTLLEKHFA